MKSSFKDRVDKRGLYANIAAKRRRIEAQKARGAKKVERMRKPGAEGAPSGDDFKKSAKTAKGQKRQDPKGNPAGYYDKEGCKTCAGGKKPCKCGKKDMVGRKTSYADGYGKKCDSIAADFESVLIRSDKKCGRSGIPEKAKCSKTTAAGTQAKGKNGAAQYAALSDKQKEQVIRKAAKGRLRNTSRATIKKAIERNKGNNSVEGRTMQKAAKRELFNRNVRNVAAVGLYGAAMTALYKNDPSIGGMMARDKNRKRASLESSFRKPSARRK